MKKIEDILGVSLFDRSSKTIAIGSCVPGPLMEYPGILSSLYNGMAIVPELAEESELLTGLRSDRFQLTILAHPVSDSDLYCQPCGSEHLYISVIAAHPAALYEKKASPSGKWTVKPS